MECGRGICKGCLVSRSPSSPASLPQLRLLRHHFLQVIERLTTCSVRGILEHRKTALTSSFTHLGASIYQCSRSPPEPSGPDSGPGLVRAKEISSWLELMGETSAGAWSMGAILSRDYKIRSLDDLLQLSTQKVSERMLTIVLLLVPFLIVGRNRQNFHPG